MISGINREEFAQAKRAAQSGDDIKPISRIVPQIVGHPDPAAAFDLVSTSSENRDLWLPEALALFNTPGLDVSQRQSMVRSVFSYSGSLQDDLCKSFATCNERLGRYGFSFPQWRYLAQAFNGVSLLQHFGMERLKRETDVRDPKLAGPKSDLFGPGFIWNKGTWYVEYRRAYIICSDFSPKNAVTLIVRNNSYFFGRDRLPEPIYVSLKPVCVNDLSNITKETFLSPGRFFRWQDMISSAQDMSLSEKARRVNHAIDFLDAFDRQLNLWLRIPGSEGGYDYFLSFLKYKLSNQGAGVRPDIPFIAQIDPRMPPWFPKLTTAVTPALFDLQAEDLKKIFSPIADVSMKIVLLSGKNGDLPLRPEI